jgi:recombination protein RecR
MVVEKDVDLENVERSKTFKGTYFVLGGSVPILEKNPEARVRIKDLKNRIEERGAQGLTEIILAFSLNPDGENTARYIAEEISAAAAKCGARVTMLGRGLSTGSELEYLDPETLKSALQNRIQNTIE